MSGMRMEVLSRDGNFRQWFDRIEAALILKGWDEWLHDEPAGDDADGIRDERRCKALMQAYTSGILSTVVRNAGSARQAWQALHQEFRGGLETRKFDLLRKATEIRQGDRSVQKYIDYARGIRDEFSEIELTDEMGLLTAQFIKGLRPSIASHVSTQLGSEVTRGADLDTICESLKTLVTFLPGREAGVARAAAARGGGFKWKCHYCGKVGHPHRECRKKQEDRDAGRKLNWAQPLGSRNAEKKQDADSGEGVALCVREARVAATTVSVNDERSDRLVFDTGATHNFVKDLSMLHDKRDSPIEMVLMGGKEAHRVACAGTVVLHGGPNGPVTLKEALCVPTMHMNLLSGGYVTDKGGSYHGKGLHLTVHGPDDRVLLTGEKVEGLYLVDCHMVRPMELVHTDVMGPFPVLGMNDEKYVVTLMDDYSRYREVICLRGKNQVAAAVIERLVEWERQTEKQLKTLRSDHGTEYKAALTRWCRRNGVVHQKSAPRTPKQNGRAERLNRTLLERMRAGLIDAGLQKMFWPYAVDNAAYTSNFVPTKGQKKSPHELFWGEVPDISHLRVFGCKATEFKPSRLRDKLDEVSTKVIFVGYARHSKAWKLLCCENGNLRVTESANVMFQEDQRQPDVADISPAAEDYEELLLFVDDPEEDQMDLVSVDTEEWSLSDEGSGDPDEEWLDQNEQMQQQPASDADMDSGDDEPAEGGGGDVMAPADERRYPQRVRNAPNLPYQAHLFLAEGVDDGVDLRIPPRNWKQAMRRPDAELWEQARDEELAALAAKGVYEVCELPVPKGKRVLNSMGALDLKFDAKGNLERHKYRLVARGDHQTANYRKKSTCGRRRRLDSLVWSGGY